MKRLKLFIYILPPLLLISALIICWLFLSARQIKEFIFIEEHELDELVFYFRSALEDSPQDFFPNVLPRSDLFLVTRYVSHHQPKRYWLKNPRPDDRFSDFISRIKIDLATLESSSIVLPTIHFKLELKTSAYIPYNLLMPELFLHHINFGDEGLRINNGPDEEFIFPTQALESGIEPKHVHSQLIKPVFQPDTELYRFKTRAVLLNVQQVDHQPVRRNQPPRRSVTRAVIFDSLRAGADFLLKHQASSGKYGYLYDPINDRYLASYNILRHGGTTFSLLQIYGLTKDERYLAGAEKAISWLVQHHVENQQDFSFVIDHNLVKLGGAALALLALSERERILGDGRDLELMRRFGKFLLHCMHENGEFRSYYQWSPAFPAPKRSSIYYPGEATFALVRLYRINGESEWLKAAMRAADFLIQRGKIAGIDVFVFPDAWLMYALAEIYEETGEIRFLTYCLKIADTLLAAQYHENENDPLFLGATVDTLCPRSTPAGARAEGLGALCRALKLTNQSQLVTKYKEALLKSASFQLSQQVHAGNCFYMRHPERAMGGFFGSIVDPTMRIDYTQHNLSSLLYTLDWLPR
ncbi:hypothetical protein ACFL27_09210 [candidate division CSSED10-310 bacterium]|uniref:Uncharacterized protein n=1 Tax=candidate division CSSED10-310 bacterium TaxID=2855610 RepID=A0ABV6YVW5_UNCC1